MASLVYLADNYSRVMDDCFKFIIVMIVWYIVTFRWLKHYSCWFSVIQVEYAFSFTEMHQLLELRDRNDKVSGHLARNRSRDFTLRQEQVEASVNDAVCSNRGSSDWLLVWKHSLKENYIIRSNCYIVTIDTLEMVDSFNNNFSYSSTVALFRLILTIG